MMSSDRLIASSYHRLRRFDSLFSARPHYVMIECVFQGRSVKGVTYSREVLGTMNINRTSTFQKDLQNTNCQQFSARLCLSNFSSRLLV